MFKKFLPKDDKYRGYETPQQSPLRHFANRKILRPAIVVLTIVGLLLINVVLHSIISIDFSGILTGKPVKLFTFNEMINFAWGRYPVFYMIAYLFLGISVLFFYFKVRFSYKPLEEEYVQGTQSFEDSENLENQYPAVQVTKWKTDEYYKGKPGFPVGRLPQTEEEKRLEQFRLLIDRADSHSVTLSHTRGGKGIFFTEWLVDILSRSEDIKDRASFIYTATKGDEPRRWFKLLKERGYRIRILNTVSQFYSDPYMPFNSIALYYRQYVSEQNLIVKNKHIDQSNRELQSVALMYFAEKKGSNDGFWVKASRSLFKAMALALIAESIEEEKPMLVNGYTIYNTVNEMFSQIISKNSHDYLKNITEDKAELKKLIEKYDGKSVLDVYFEEMDRRHPAKIHYYSMKASAPAKSTLGNIITHFSGDLEMFLQSGNAKLTAVDDGFNFESIGFDEEQPTAIFIMLSDAEESNNMLGLLYLEQVYQTLIRKCYDALSAKCFRQVHFILEEAGNIGAILDLMKKWSASLGRDIYWHLVLQDLEQLTEIYGQNAKSIILGNTGNLNYIRSGSLDTNKYISERIGKRPNYSKTRNKTAITLQASETESSERIPLKEPFELENLMYGETILLRLMHTHDNNGEPIYQTPIFNSYETDTNLFEFFKWRNLETVSWDEIPVNNSFMSLDMDELLWSLSPEERSESDKKKKLSIPKRESKRAKKEISKEKESKKQKGEKIELTKIEIESIVPKYQFNKIQKGGIPVPLDRAIDPIRTLKEEKQRDFELFKKEKKNQLEQAFSLEELDSKVKDYFPQNQLSQLNVLINNEFLKEATIQQEYQTISEKLDVGSLISFVLSNGSQRLIENVVGKLIVWKEQTKNE
ncbi:type IV secretory system conjugative DNA transfer family protein [Carnobacterium maltaromaticum]|uniref:type IV secretory system conjugative DNA transfer family protein n=1 Tax=Carnobacterium maltaromaticum TaxID=2751 RepID=UPI0012F91C3C|nr:type IV secretory system conjugative DNA transfer family protein [Carnobacterium maltaromaticum]